MKIRRATMAVVMGLVAVSAPAEAKKCSADAVQVQAVCVDKYEASVWETTDAKTVKNIQKGKIKNIGGLAMAAQHGVTGDDYGAGCPDPGTGCKTFYAVSIPSVKPAANLTWFQAAAACRNAGKRLLTNQEWQTAALGTPDPGTDSGTADCNIASAGPANTGSRSLCISESGAFDMVGNLWEWIADWGTVANGCDHYSASYGNDVSCVGSNTPGGLPGALLRGGDFGAGTDAGVFAISANLLNPTVSTLFFGFRCGRDL